MGLSGESSDRSGRSVRLPSRAVVWTLAGILAVAASLPAVWWERLHPDEVVVLTIAPRSFGQIVEDVFVERGGAPVHFFLEHLLLAWPGGLEGLRIPSIVFFLLALPAAGLVAEKLTDRTAALALVPALALAPLAVELATFGRMYTLFLATTLWATYLAVVAAERGRPLLWAAAGAALGLLVYVHPIAPLYMGIALASALVHGWRGLRETVRAAWPGAVTLAAVSLPFFLMSLGTLKTRYDVKSASDRLQTQEGDSVVELALETLLPGGPLGRIVFAVLGLAGLVFLARSRSRSAVVLGLWIVMPAAFFTLVPAGGTSFFARYLLVALPFVLLAVVMGALSLAGGRLGEAGIAASALAVLALLAAEAKSDAARVRHLAGSDLRALVEGVERHGRDGVIFPSLVSRQLDRLVALEFEGLQHVESDCRQLALFLAGPPTPRTGIWVLDGSPSRLRRSLPRLDARDDVDVEQIGGTIALVTSREALPPRELVSLGLDLRDDWFAGDKPPVAIRVTEREARALAGECPPATGNAYSGGS